MRGISTLNLLLKGSVFALGLLFTNQSFAQVDNTCSEILADFNTNDNGFDPGDFTYVLPSNGDGHLAATISSDVTSTTTLILTSPLIVNPTQNGFADYGFTLSGYIRGTTYTVVILNEAGVPIAPPAPLVELPVSPNPNSNNQNTTVCVRIADERLELGARIRYQITIYSPDPRGNGNKDVTIEFDDFSVGGVAQIILPVNFIGFTARQASNGAQLIWNVADEVDVARYEVQKGTTAGNFRTIGTVTAGERTTYSFLDVQPTTGVSFYRIRSVDLDGKYKFSTIISFSNGNSMALLRAYPMPARNQVTLQHGTIEGRAQITVASEDGRVVRRVVPSTGSMQTSIDLSSLKAGLYLLRLESSNGEVQTLKLVKQ